MPVAGLLLSENYLAVGLRTEFDPADVAHARHIAIAAGLDDHIFELGGVARAGR